MPIDTAHADELRRLALENAIASGELEGIEYTAPMRDLLDTSNNPPFAAT